MTERGERGQGHQEFIPQKPANEVKNSEIPIIEVSKTQFEKIKKTFANLKSNKSKEKDIKR